MPTMSSDPVSTVRRAVKLWIDRVGPGLYGLACSGGADSMALADAAIAVAGATNVIVVHVDHGLSAGSAQVASAVAAWASENGVRLHLSTFESHSPGRVAEAVTTDAHVSEAAARELRYAAFETARKELGLSHIFLAHTGRDQAETVLMRVLRGTGPAGLAGMSPVRDHYVRPLLELSRDAIDAYVAARALPIHIDPMNADHAFTRVRMREQILPLLRAENPALDDALLRLASSAAEWLDAIDDLAEPFARFPIDCAGLGDQSAAIRKRAIALALEGAGLGYDAQHLEAIDDLITAPAAGERSLDLAGGRLVRSYDQLAIASRGSAEARSAPEGSAKSIAGGQTPELPPHAANEHGAYVVRPWTAGDRMKPARLKGRSRKLSDLFIDAKIPRALRASARVVIRVEDDAIIYAEHLGIAHDTSPNDSEFLRTISFASQVKGPMLSNARG